MHIEGTWVASDGKRSLVFLPNGEGYIRVEEDKFPFFQWWVEEGAFSWRFFLESDHRTQMGKGGPMNCKEVVENSQRQLVFEIAPIPFGFKQFTFELSPNPSFKRDQLKLAP